MMQNGSNECFYIVIDFIGRRVYNIHEKCTSTFFLADRKCAIPVAELEQQESWLALSQGSQRAVNSESQLKRGE